MGSTLPTTKLLMLYYLLNLVLTLYNFILCLKSSSHPISITMGDVEVSNGKADSKSLSPWTNEKKGGFKACTFVYVMAALENMGFIANMDSMVLYFFWVMHFDLSTASNTLTNFMGATFLLSIVGAFISDTFLNRFHTVLLFGALEILSLVLVTIQAYSKDLHPEACGKHSCVEGHIKFMLYTSLCMLALGSGGVRGAFPSLGADQFDQKDPKQVKALASYFNFLTLSIVSGACIGVTFIVWISMNKGWYKGFLISTVATFLGFLVLVLGKPFYRLRQPEESPLLRIIQVIYLAIKNSRLPIPENANQLYEISDKEITLSQEKIAHTNQFGFLDKAAIVRNDSKTGPWRVCTVTQVEEVKILTRMLPILASTIIMNTCMAQLQTFSVEQGSMMNGYIRKFQVPAPSIPVIPLLFMVILIPIYEFVFVPFARKITGHPSGITQLQRVGVGLVLSAISMAVAGIVEVKRRNQSRKDFSHQISLFWLSFQYGIFGIADMFTLVGLLEFFYKEAPAVMKSLSTSFTWLSLSFGYFLSTVFVDIINAITKRVTPSKLGWLHGLFLDDNNLNLFYWFLAILSCLNFLNYLYWASWYKYRPESTTSTDTNPRTNTEALNGLLLPKVVENTDDEQSNATKTSGTDTTSTFTTAATTSTTFITGSSSGSNNGEEGTVKDKEVNGKEENTGESADANAKVDDEDQVPSSEQHKKS